jgi:hypothetical protein
MDDHDNEIDELDSKTAPTCTLYAPKAVQK